MKSATSTVLLLGLLLAGSRAFGFAHAESRNGRHSVEWNGAVRLNGGAFFDAPRAFGLTEGGMTSSEARLMGQGVWADNFDYELHFFGASASGLPNVNGAFISSVNTLSSYRSPHFIFYDNQSGSVSGGVGLDRAMLRYNGQWFSLAVGRFPVNFSVATFGTVNDFFAPFSASAINTAYKPGVDAIDVSVQTGNFSSIELVGVLGHNDAFDNEGTPSLNDSAVLLYGRTLAGPADLALLGGRLARKWVVGAQLQTELGPFSFYEEAHVGFPDADQVRDIYVKSATGFNVMFSLRNATLGGEYLFSSEGTSPDRYMASYLTLSSPDELPYAGRHYSFFSGAIELHPLIQAGAAFLMNVQDRSGLATFSISFNIGNNAECVAGALFPFGKETTWDNAGQLQLNSEFGNSPITTFAELRYYI